MSSWLLQLLSCGLVILCASWAAPVAVPEECVVTEFSDWSDCSGNCAQAHRIRNRRVLWPSMPVDGVLTNPCPPLYQVETCVLPRCGAQSPDFATVLPPQGACAVTEWSKFSECHGTCEFGVEVRNRKVTWILMSPFNDSSPCPYLYEARRCAVPDCNGQSNAAFFTRLQSGSTDFESEIPENLLHVDDNPEPMPTQTDSQAEDQQTSTTFTSSTNRPTSAAATASPSTPLQPSLSTLDNSHNLPQTDFNAVPPTSQSQTLNTVQTDLNQDSMGCIVSEWESWSCQGDCRRAVSIRNRWVVRPSLRGPNDMCPHKYEARPCTLPTCSGPSNATHWLPTPTTEACLLSTWEAWSACLGTCERAVRTRNRLVLWVSEQVSRGASNCPYLFEIKKCNRNCTAQPFSTLIEPTPSANRQQTTQSAKLSRSDFQNVVADRNLLPNRETKPQFDIQSHSTSMSFSPTTTAFDLATLGKAADEELQLEVANQRQIESNNVRRKPAIANKPFQPDPFPAAPSPTQPNIPPSALPNGDASASMAQQQHPDTLLNSKEIDQLSPDYGQFEFYQLLEEGQDEPNCTVGEWSSWQCMGDCEFAYQIRNRAVIKPAFLANGRIVGPCPNLYEVSLCTLDGCSSSSSQSLQPNSRQRRPFPTESAWQTTKVLNAAQKPSDDQMSKIMHAVDKLRKLQNGPSVAVEADQGAAAAIPTAGSFFERGHLPTPTLNQSTYYSANNNAGPAGTDAPSNSGHASTQPDTVYHQSGRGVTVMMGGRQSNNQPPRVTSAPRAFARPTETIITDPVVIRHLAQMLFGSSTTTQPIATTKTSSTATNAATVVSRATENSSSLPQQLNIRNQKAKHNSSHTQPTKLRTSPPSPPIADESEYDMWGLENATSTAATTTENLSKRKKQPSSHKAHGQTDFNIPQPLDLHTQRSKLQHNSSTPIATMVTPKPFKARPKVNQSAASRRTSGNLRQIKSKKKTNASNSINSALPIFHPIVRNKTSANIDKNNARQASKLPLPTASRPKSRASKQDSSSKKPVNIRKNTLPSSSKLVSKISQQNLTQAGNNDSDAPDYTSPVRTVNIPPGQFRSINERQFERYKLWGVVNSNEAEQTGVED